MTCRPSSEALQHWSGGDGTQAASISNQRKHNHNHNPHACTPLTSINHNSHEARLRLSIPRKLFPPLSRTSHQECFHQIDGSLPTDTNRSGHSPPMTLNEQQPSLSRWLRGCCENISPRTEHGHHIAQQHLLLLLPRAMSGCRPRSLG